MQRIVLVTGVSRRAGIGAGIVRRLVRDGHAVFGTGWPAHDQEMPWGSRPEDVDELVLETRADRGAFSWAPGDFEKPDEPERLVAAAVERFGALDCIVAAHARSSSSNLAEVSAAELDRCWAVNARASVLLAQALGRTFDRQRAHGRLVLFTSGQHLGPMGDELAYAVSKGAIHQMTASLADQLADQGITVNCINPGPVDTGWVSDDLRLPLARRFPGGRWGTPDDIARIASWLCSKESAWLTGQVLDAEGGFRRWVPVERDR